MEREWVRPQDPVFNLVPPTFQEQVVVLYAEIGQPEVSSDNFWPVYQQLLTAFCSLPSTANFRTAFAVANEGEEDEVPVLEGLRDLRNGGIVVGTNDHVYYGGLEIPPASEDENATRDNEDDSDPRDYATFSD